MRRLLSRLVGGVAPAFLAWPGPVQAAPDLACNPDPPVPPVLEGYAYDETARRVLLSESPGIAVARLGNRLDLSIGDAQRRQSYVFEVSEGWRRIAPRRLVIGDYWISCELELRPGGYYLLYLEGTRPLYILPAEQAAAEVAALGDIDWFYDPHGTLVRPELVNVVEEDSAGPGEADEGDEGGTRVRGEEQQR